MSEPSTGYSVLGVCGMLFAVGAFFVSLFCLGILGTLFIFAMLGGLVWIFTAPGYDLLD